MTIKREHKCFWVSFYNTPEFDPSSELDRMLVDALREDCDFSDLMDRCLEEDPDIHFERLSPRVVGPESYIVRVGKGTGMSPSGNGYVVLIQSYCGKLYFSQVTNRVVVASPARGYEIVMRTYNGMQKYPYVRHLILTLSKRGTTIENQINNSKKG